MALRASALLLALAASTALAHDTIPLNAVQNGSFEAGLAGWSVVGSGISLAAGGTQGSALALDVPNGFQNRYAHQALPPLVLGTQGVLLDFDARIVASGGRAGFSVVEALSSWNPVTGTGQFTAHVAFTEGQVGLGVWTTDPLGEGVWVAAPADGAWHHYQVVGTGVLGVAQLLIDGSPVAVASGDPGSIGVPDRLIVGDVAGCDCSLGPAPDMVYDELWYGPQM